MLKDRTKVLLAETFREMMRTTKIERIRVEDLCQRCEISRRTFYYHFSDKYELMAWIVDNGFNPADGSTSALFSADSRAKLFRTMKEDAAFYRSMYLSANISDMLRHLVEYDTAHYEEMAKAELGVAELDASKAFSIRMYVYGGIYLTREWVINGFDTDPEDLAEMMADAMPEWLSELAARHAARTGNAS